MMSDRTIANPVTGERLTFLETSRESAGARTVGDMEVVGRGGVPGHSHDNHEERIDVLEGLIEVTVEARRHRLGAGEHIVIPRGKVHAWRNASPDRPLKFRGTMTPGHPGFEVALSVLFGLARDGEVRRNGIPRHFGDLALFTEWNDGLPSGPIRILKPLFTWAARRARARGRDAELLRRYGCDDPSR
jgi:quercetin dioxygenase-like cupin family protein